MSTRKGKGKGRKFHVTTAYKGKRPGSGRAKLAGVSKQGPRGPKGQGFTRGGHYYKNRLLKHWEHYSRTQQTASAAAGPAYKAVAPIGNLNQRNRHAQYVAASPVGAHIGPGGLVHLPNIPRIGY